MRLRVIMLSFVLGASFAPSAWAEGARAKSVKLTVLSTMLADSKGVGEWGFAALVEVDGRKLLFDTGMRPETVWANAKEMGVNLAAVDELVLSHHHGDHTGGLLTVRREASKIRPEALGLAYVGPGIFLSRPDADGKETNETVGFKEPYEATGGKFVEVAKPTEISPGVWLTGPVPRPHPERNWSGNKRIKTADGLVEDTLPEDISLVIDTDRGLVVVTGCGHAGIVNILDHARASIRKTSVHAIVGGLHLFPADDAALEWTAGNLRDAGVARLLGAHCTGIEAVYELRRKLGLARSTCVVGAVGAGFTLEEGIRPGMIAH